MTDIDIYTKSWCGSSARAKSLLDRKGLAYREIDVTADGAKELEMIRRSDARTVPQIFIRDQNIGGHDDLVALDAKGDLDRPLTPARAES